MPAGRSVSIKYLVKDGDFMLKDFKDELAFQQQRFEQMRASL